MKASLIKLSLLLGVAILLIFIIFLYNYIWSFNKSGVVNRIGKNLSDHKMEFADLLKSSQAINDSFPGKTIYVDLQPRLHSAIVRERKQTVYGSFLPVDFNVSPEMIKLLIQCSVDLVISSDSVIELHLANIAGYARQYSLLLLKNKLSEAQKKNRVNYITSETGEWYYELDSTLFIKSSKIN